MAMVRRFGSKRSSTGLRAWTNRACGMSSARVSASPNGWIGSPSCPITSAGTAICRRTDFGGAMRPNSTPCSSAAIDAGSCESVSVTTSTHWLPCGTRLAASATPRTETGRKRAANSSGAKVSSPATIALSSTGISTTSPSARSGCETATSSATFAPSEVPPITARSIPRWSSNATACCPNAGIEYRHDSAGRSESPCPSRSSVTTRKPDRVSRRASGACMRRVSMIPCISTTTRSPAPNSV